MKVQGSYFKRLVLLAGLVTMAFGLAGCGGSTPGQPTPGATSDTSAAETSSDTEGNSLPVNEPCSLLSPGDLQRIGVSVPPTSDMVGTAHDCSLNTDDFDIGIAIRENGGLDDYRSAGGTIRDTTIGSHQAKQVTDATGSCVIAVGVSGSSRVDITVAPTLSADPCPMAENVAKLVEPKLP